MLEKIQNLPIRIRKIILWLTLIILAIFLFSFWIKNFRKRITEISKENLQRGLKVEKLQESLQSIKLPSFELPSPPKEK